MSKFHEILTQYWGYDSFRENQLEIISSLANKHDTLAILPTGGGKSICFQVPTLASGGLCIVVSPLIALMQDQVQQLKQRNIRAEMIVSGMSLRQQDIAYNNCIFGEYNFLYISPERLANETFLERFKEMPVQYIAVDEAHCISQWGFDFRPSYLEIKQLRDIHQVPIIALTATATPNVKEDITEKLELNAPTVIQGSLKRDNLSFQIRETPDKFAKTVEILQKLPGQSIIYCNSRRNTKMIAEEIQQLGIPATYYHAGLTKQKRSQIQNDWIANKQRVIVATNAFGMGIDKDDVRIVIHFNMPESLEAYYQEAGRAGRDGKNAVAVLLYNKEDIQQLNENRELRYPPVKVLKNILVGIFNYLEINIGDGLHRPYQFSMYQFAKRYNLDPKLIYHALELFVRDGWLTLSEPFYNPSSLQINLNNEELYRFQVKQPKFEQVIKFLLRNYGGILDQQTKINEESIAQRLQKEHKEILNELTQLHRIGVIQYYPQSEFPLLTPLRERPQNQDIFFDLDQINFLKERFNHRLDAMIQYTTNTDRCRTVMIQNYFGEQVNRTCGICDDCMKQRAKHQNLDSNLEEKIIYEIRNEAQSEDVLLTKFSISRLQLRAILSYLAQEHIIIKQNSLWQIKK